MDSTGWQTTSTLAECMFEEIGLGCLGHDLFCTMEQCLHAAGRHHQQYLHSNLMIDATWQALYTHLTHQDLNAESANRADHRNEWTRGDLGYGR